jgi:hypothetical protein
VIPAELLAVLRAAGVRLSADGERLRCRAPAGVLTPELRSRLSEHKAALLAALKNNPGLRCPECGKPLAADRCWNCAKYRRCACGRNTGSAFISICLPCQFTPGDRS